MPDFTDLISQAKKMQDKMKETQEVLKKIEVEGVSGGAAVKVTMNGDGELKKIILDDKLLKESKAQDAYDRIYDYTGSHGDEPLNYLDKYTPPALDRLRQKFIDNPESLSFSEDTKLAAFFNEMADEMEYEFGE